MLSMIRKANVKDLKQVKRLHDLYVLDVSRLSNPNYIAKVKKEGFTVSPGKSDLSRRIHESQIFDVYEIDGKIAGYIDINKEVYFPEEADNIVWVDPKLKTLYFKGKDTTCLHHIAVLPEHKKKGVASKLFKNSLEKLRTKGVKYLFAIITTGPVANKPSIVFHQKMGFIKACETKPIDLFGLKNYESVLFYRKIK